MKGFNYIITGLLGVSLIVICIILGKPKEAQEDDKYIKEMQGEIETLKGEIKDIHRELLKNYEKIDTITTSNGANEHINDFIERAGGELPPGRQHD